MRSALALAGTALVLTAACAQNFKSDRDMQPNPGTGYTVYTTGADLVGRDDPNAVEGRPAQIDDVAGRLASQICERESRCHSGKRSAADCRQANLGRARTELHSWNCSPAATRARAEECLASIGAEPCELDFASRATLCASNAACGSDDTRAGTGSSRTTRGTTAK